MTAKEFNSVARNQITDAVATCEICENLAEQLKRFLDKFGAQGVFAYASWCEQNFELNLREDYKRISTFTADLSIAEWCYGFEGISAVTDTIKNALNSWKDDYKMFAELIIAVNMKSWEHHARGNQNWSGLYAEFYYIVKSLYFEWYNEDNNEHDKAMQYYYDYVD